MGRRTATSEEIKGECEAPRLTTLPVRSDAWIFKNPASAGFLS
jgi:hypothetical protein